MNNEFIALAKQGRSQAKLADVLTEMRGVEWSGITQDNHFKRGPMTSWEIGVVIREVRPEIGPDATYNRAYQALRGLRDKGRVRREGRVWSLSH